MCLIIAYRITLLFYADGMLRRGLSRPEPRLLSMRYLSSATGGGSAGTTEGVSSETAPLRPRPNALTDEIIRVDHAGELGADRIYAGQMAILGNGPLGKTIGHMWEQEKEHRKQFEQLIQQHRVRPTIMTPIWNVAGFVLGAGTALMGEKAAMACTVAVETVIVEHYNDQLRQIMEAPNPDKVSTICNSPKQRTK